MTNPHPNAAPHQWQTQPPEPPKKKRRGLKITLGVIGALVVISALANAGEDTAAPPAAAPAPAPAAPAPAAEQEPAPEPEPAPELAGPLSTMGNGEYVVGEDVAPGRYRSPGPEESFAPMCYYDVKTAGGAFVDQGVVPEGPARVTLKEGQLFTSTGCQDWERA